jgi:hypothetical protein
MQVTNRIPHCRPYDAYMNNMTFKKRIPFHPASGFLTATHFLLGREKTTALVSCELSKRVKVIDNCDILLPVSDINFPTCEHAFDNAAKRIKFFSNTDAVTENLVQNLNGNLTKIHDCLQEQSLLSRYDPEYNPFGQTSKLVKEFGTIKNDPSSSETINDKNIETRVIEMNKKQGKLIENGKSKVVKLQFNIDDGFLKAELKLVATNHLLDCNSEETLGKKIADDRKSANYFVVCSDFLKNTDDDWRDLFKQLICSSNFHRMINTFELLELYYKTNQERDIYSDCAIGSLLELINEKIVNAKYYKAFRYLEYFLFEFRSENLNLNFHKSVLERVLSLD